MTLQDAPQAAPLQPEKIPAAPDPNEAGGVLTIDLAAIEANWKKLSSMTIPVEFAGPSHRLSRADLEISGIYHGESSYEGRIFLNNPTATAATSRTARSGYAGVQRHALVWTGDNSSVWEHLADSIQMRVESVSVTR